MGMFLNPSNAAFQKAVNSKIYVDKTGLLKYTNNVVNTQQAFICNSRPRRFGKSMAADMLLAYYSKNNDSRELFAGLEIHGSADFEKYLNKYDVIYFDAQECIDYAQNIEDSIAYITKCVIAELREAYKEVLPLYCNTIAQALGYINAATRNKFVIIIDEWDAMFRVAPEKRELHEKYISFLRSLFKGASARRFMALAYITGILPIKKYNTQSTLNNFDEYTMVSPGPLAPYFGFTEAEVLALCQEYQKDFVSIKRWYDGYRLNGLHIYNPFAVTSLMLQGDFRSYWLQTGTYESIKNLIQINFDGLRTDIITALAGNKIKANPYFFQNDMETFDDKNDVLALLIHLGYLAYDPVKEEAYIPNEEIRTEFQKATQSVKWQELKNFFVESDNLLQAIKNGNSDKVAQIIEAVHEQYISAIQYNDENSLSCVLTIAFLGTIDFYFRPIREFPSGKGFADFVYLPKPEYAANYPALVVELKWDKTAETALAQIKEKKYPQSIDGYTDEILLVGINYDKKTKEHTCVIEKMEK